MAIVNEEKFKESEDYRSGFEDGANTVLEKFEESMETFKEAIKKAADEDTQEKIFNEIGESEENN